MTASVTLVSFFLGAAPNPTLNHHSPKYKINLGFFHLFFQVFSAKIDYNRVQVMISEFARTEVQYPLSSLVILVKKSRHLRRL
jgi:hypothetical protein